MCGVCFKKQVVKKKEQGLDEEFKKMLKVRSILAWTVFGCEPQSCCHGPVLVCCWLFSGRQAEGVPKVQAADQQRIRHLVSR